MVLLNVTQHLHYLLLAVVLGGKVRESLYPQVGILVADGRRVMKGGWEGGG